MYKDRVKIYNLKKAIKNSKGKALVTASNEIIPRKKSQEKERVDNRLISRDDEKETINNINE